MHDENMQFASQPATRLRILGAPLRHGAKGGSIL
jgi:hypothetical protein